MIFYKIMYKFFLIIIIGMFFILSGCSNKDNNHQGYIEANLTYVSTSEPGKLVNLLVKRGEHIKSGQLLFKLEKEPLIYSQEISKYKLSKAKSNYKDNIIGKRLPYINELESNIKKSQAAYKLANASYKRWETLYDKKAVSLDEFEQYKAKRDESLEDVNSLKYQLTQVKLPLSRENQLSSYKDDIDIAENSLKISQWKLNQVNVKAPASGVIFDTYYWKGEKVESYNPVVSILVPDQIKLVFFVNEKDLSNIKIGEDVKFKVDGVIKPYDARISFISNIAEYTPTLIYSEKSREDLVYRVEAKITSNMSSSKWHPGQPVSIMLSDLYKAKSS